MLVTWIAEIADEDLLLDGTDHDAEARTNTWSLRDEPANHRELTIEQVVAAFYSTAEALGARVRELGFPGLATFRCPRGHAT